jgi:hypothetical protein
MANATFGQFAANWAKRRTLQKEKEDRRALIASVVGLTLAIAFIFGWVGLSRQSPVGDVTAKLELFQQNQLSARLQREQSKPIKPAPFPTGVEDHQSAVN